MIIDHIGYYFFPEQLWWRAVGRIGFPIWFFLIGHASSRAISPLLIGGTVILLTANAVVGLPLLPVNALGSIILIRLVIDPLMRVIGTCEMRLFAATALLCLLAPVTNLWWEYGTMALILAMAGHVARRGFGSMREMPLLYGLISVALFVYMQALHFDFSVAQNVFDAAGSTLVMLALLWYLPRRDVAPNWRWIKLLGRRTLEIYVLHLVLFKAILFSLQGCQPAFCLLGAAIRALGIDPAGFLA